MYQNPTMIPGCTTSEPELQRHFDEFYQDMFMELSLKYGELEELHICDNIGDHLIGNMYVKFKFEEDAAKAADGMNARFYDGMASHLCPLFLLLIP